MALPSSGHPAGATGSGSSGAAAPEHGGGLDSIRRRFPLAPEPWIDLSTGINPWPYPVPEIPAAAWQRLPARSEERAVRLAAAAYYSVPEDLIVLAPGSQTLIQWLPYLRPRGRVAVVGPTYSEHASCWAAAGHEVTTVTDEAHVPEFAQVVILARPNNPDGRVVALPWLADQAARLGRSGGWLVVDEAFADVLDGPSVFREISEPSLIALRSFGKFFGLAGCRLGMALAPPALCAALTSALGPWCVSGPALAVAQQALADTAWIAATRARLSEAAARLDRLASEAGLRLVGGTALFRLYESTRASELFERLAHAGILARKFSEHPGWLRLGLPASATAENRLRAALTAPG